MKSEDIYTYFNLEAKLYDTLIDWLRNKIKDTPYKVMPYKIKAINLIYDGCIRFDVIFLDDDVEEDQSFIIRIEELENVI